MCIRDSLQADDQQSLKAHFHANTAGWEVTGEITTPWRVTIVADNLNDLVNNDIVHNLCPPAPAELANASWIKPGRSLWQWWNSGGPKYNEQKQWVDWAKQLGFEYYLIDEGWDGWKVEGKDKWACLKEAVDYAKSQGVEVIAWVHSKQVFKPEDRKVYFDNAKACGVVGLKIDFPPRGNVDVINWYEDTLRDAAALHFMVDFHGAVKPTGRDRTWPNEVSREGIRGHEWHIRRYKRVLPPEHDTILPFSRYINGHADYTPVAFNPAELNGYTWARELAQAIVFTSPFLCYADHPKFYLENPALEMLKSIPSVWNETVVLPGSEIGKVAAFARRSGNRWFIGVMNGAEPVELKIPLSFLGSGSFSIDKWGDTADRDDAWEHTTEKVGNQDLLTLKIRKAGGFVGRLDPATP